MGSGGVDKKWSGGKGSRRSGGGRAYSFVTCLRHLTVHHASPSSIAFEAKHNFYSQERHLPTFRRSWRFSHVTHNICVLLVSCPSRFAFRGRRLSLRIVIVFSRLSINSIPIFSMSHSSTILISHNLTHFFPLFNRMGGRCQTKQGRGGGG